MKVRVIPTLVILASLIALNSTVSGILSARPSELADDDARFRMLAERLIGVSGVPEHTLIVGELPESLSPEDIPIPNNTQLLGSVVRGHDYIEIVLDSTQSSDEIKTFYQEQFLDDGWQLAKEPVTAWGFSGGSQFQGETDELPVFCSANDNTMLRITAWELPQNPSTDVRLTMLSSQNSGLLSPCHTVASIDLPPLPGLRFPPEVTLSTGHSGSDKNLIYTDAMVSMPMQSDVLLSYLGEQFEQVGWTPIEQGNDDVLSWASWVVEDENGETWQSTLNIIQLQGISDQYFVRAQAMPRVDLSPESL